MQDLTKLTKKDLKQYSKNQLIEMVLVIPKLLERINVLERKVEELEYKLSLYQKNSSNSSKPPSSDINKPNRNQSQRESSGKKPGGQNGHEGSTRNQVKNPDEVIKIFPDSCKKCGKKLSQKKALLEPVLKVK